MSDTDRPEFTRAEKAAAWDWLRRVALDDNNPHAQVAIVEWQAFFNALRDIAKDPDADARRLKCMAVDALTHGDRGPPQLGAESEADRPESPPPPPEPPAKRLIHERAPWPFTGKARAADQPDDALREAVVAAYKQGALDVHRNYQPDRDPDFTEAAHDYASDVLHADGGPVQPSAARPLSEWHEDDGPVLWWVFPIQEPPYCGDPNWDNWPGYHTHWTRIEVPRAADNGDAGP